MSSTRRTGVKDVGSPTLTAPWVGRSITVIAGQKGRCWGTSRRLCREEASEHGVGDQTSAVGQAEVSVCDEQMACTG